MFVSHPSMPDEAHISKRFPPCEPSGPSESFEPSRSTLSSTSTPLTQPPGGHLSAMVAEGRPYAYRRAGSSASRGEQAYPLIPVALVPRYQLTTADTQWSATPDPTTHQTARVDKGELSQQPRSLQRRRHEPPSDWQSESHCAGFICQSTQY
jgi:hypothetical protein